MNRFILCFPQTIGRSYLYRMALWSAESKGLSPFVKIFRVSICYFLSRRITRWDGLPCRCPRNSVPNTYICDFFINYLPTIPLLRPLPVNPIAALCWLGDRRFTPSLSSHLCLKYEYFWYMLNVCTVHFPSVYLPLCFQLRGNYLPIPKDNPTTPQG